MTAVLGYCGAYRSTMFHVVQGPLETLPTSAPNVAGFQRLPTDPVGSAILTIASEVDLTGAEVRVYDLDLAGIGNLGTELAGTESCPTAEFSYNYSYGFTPNQVWIQVMKAGYKEYGQRYTLPTRDTTLSLILSEELNT